MDTPSRFWLVRLLHLAFVIPANLLNGAGQQPGAVWPGRLATVTRE